MKVQNGEDLTDRIKFIHPDDDNVDDQSVISVTLSKPIGPGETINLDIKLEYMNIPVSGMRLKAAGTATSFMQIQNFMPILVYIM